MHKLILLTIAAFLILPPSLSAQNHLPPSLDPDNATGGQAVTPVNISPDQIISILVRIEAKIDNLDKRVVRLEAKVDDLDKRVIRIEAKIDNLDKRVTRLETKVDNLDKKFDDLDKRVVRLETKVDNLDKKFDDLDGRVDNLGNRLDGLLLILVAGLLGMPLLNNWLEKRRETKRLPQVNKSSTQQPSGVRVPSRSEVEV